jgi:RNA polymerase sigma-70 factor (ECF subfamily)
MRSVRGRNRVARAVVTWVRRVGRIPGVSFRWVEVNGDAGALFLDAQQRVIGVCSVEVSGGEITSISGIVNPDKLTHLGQVGDLASLMRSG